MKFLPLKFIAFLYFLLLPQAWQAQAHERTLTLSQDMHETYLGQYLYIYKDPSKTLTIQEIMSPSQNLEFFQTGQAIPNFGFFDRSTFWAKLTVNNPLPEALDVYIVSTYAPLDNLTVYWEDEEGQIQSLTLGDQVPFTQRPIRNRLPIFPLSFQPGISTIYFQVTSYSSVQLPIVMWTSHRLMEFQAQDHILLGGLFTACIIMFFYNFFVYLKFHSRAYLYYVIYIFSFFTFSSFFHGIFQMYVLPEAEKSQFINIGQVFLLDLCCICAINFAVEFLSLKSRAPRIYRFFYIWRIICIINLANWLSLQFFALPVALLNNMVVAIVMIGSGLYMSRKYKPARFFTLAWSFLLLGTIAQILISGGVLPMNSLTIWSQAIGATIELVLLSLALGDRVALINQERELALQQKAKIHEELMEAERQKANMQQSLLAERENHIRSLDHLVHERTRDIRSILASINQGIFTIGMRDDKLFIHQEFSAFLLSILDATELSEKDPIENIFAKFSLNADTLDQIKNVLAISLGESELNFAMNSKLLPHELKMKKAASSLVFELEWTPIIDSDDVIEKILVAIKDVTQLRKLREISHQQEYELIITGELVSQQGQKFPIIKSSCLMKHAVFIGRMKESSCKLEVLHRDILNHLHTLKGEVRVCGFSTLAQTIHETEDELIKCQSFDVEFFQSQLQKIVDTIEVYNQIYQHKLGRRDEVETTVVANDLELEELMDDFEQALTLKDRKLERFTVLYEKMNQVLGLELKSILAAHIQDLEKASKQLGKSVPHVVFKGSSIRFPRKYHNTLREIFGHILRNSLDHGLESKLERRQNNKPPAGTITFELQKDGDEIIIYYSDDGRGLDILKIAEKAGQKGLVKEAIDDLDVSDIASYILQPELSTSDEVTISTGRGIGMDAAKTLLQSISGDIEVQVGETKDPESRYYNFCFKITFRLQDKKQTKDALQPAKPLQTA